MTETNMERLDRIKRTARHDELATRTGPKPIVLLDPADYDFLVEQAQQTIDIQIQFVELHRDWLGLRTENNRIREALLELSQGKFDCYEDECANFALKALAGDPDGQR